MILYTSDMYMLKTASYNKRITAVYMIKLTQLVKAAG